MAGKTAVRAPLCWLLLLLLPFAAVSAEEEGRTLYVYTWNDYFDSEVINLFQRAFDCRVEISSFASNEDMYAALAGDDSSYDIVTPSSYMSSKLYGEGLLLPLDHSRLPNLVNLNREVIPESEDPDHVYSVPYTISVAGVLYDKRRVERSDRGGWDIFANPRYSGRVTLIDDMRETMGAALKHLGYSLNTTDPDELAACAAVLAAWRDNASSILGDDMTLELDAANRVVSHAYNGDAALAISEDANAGFYIPREGSSQTSDDFVVMAGAESPDLAHAFINFLLEPDVARRNMEGIFFYMPNAPALDLISPELKDNPAFDISPEAIKRCEALRDLRDAAGLYDAVWARVMGE